MSAPSGLVRMRRTWSFATRLAVKRAQFAMARALGSVPVVTYATWRTASTSVHHAIRASGRRAAVKAHAIHRPNIGGARLSVLDASSRPATHVGDWAVHRHVLSGNRRADWVILVRDPLAMALSMAALAARSRQPGIPADDVMDRLLAEAPVGGLDWWLEHDMRPALGWCALDVPFDRDLGWAESECSRGRVLVLRVDLPDSHKDEVLSRFLGTRVHVVPNNGSRSGGRGPVLDALLRRLEAHPAIVTASLAQRSARHFWHEDQLLRLRAR